MAQHLDVILHTKKYFLILIVDFYVLEVRFTISEASVAELKDRVDLLRDDGNNELRNKNRYKLL